MASPRKPAKKQLRPIPPQPKTKKASASTKRKGKTQDDGEDDELCYYYPLGRPSPPVTRASTRKKVRFAAKEGKSGNDADAVTNPAIEAKPAPITAGQKRSQPSKSGAENVDQATADEQASNRRSGRTSSGGTTPRATCCVPASAASSRRPSSRSLSVPDRGAVLYLIRGTIDSRIWTFSADTQVFGSETWEISN